MHDFFFTNVASRQTNQCCQKRSLLCLGGNKHISLYINLRKSAEEEYANN